MSCRRALLAAATFALGRSVPDAVTPRDNVVGLADCVIGDLFLRSPADQNGNAKPIDVKQVVGAVRSYTATLDYKMDGFLIDALAHPRDRCTVRKTDSSLVLVAPGHSIVTQIYADAADGSDPNSPAYSVNASRLAGSETELSFLHVAGAVMMPEWNPSTRTYAVYLNVEQDIVEIDLDRLDSDQIVAIEAQVEKPLRTSVVASRRLSSMAAQERVAQAPVGEVQRQPSKYMTMVDVGHERIVDIRVRSANGRFQDQYRLSVSRPFCPEDRRFFDRQARACVEICNDGHFGNPELGRCTPCPTPHCAICNGGLFCTLCKEGYAANAEGVCVDQNSAPPGGRMEEQLPPRMISNNPEADEEDPLEQQRHRSHRALLVGVSSAAAVAVCACAALICCAGGAPVLLMWRWGDDEDDDSDLSARFAGFSYRSGAGSPSERQLLRYR